MQVTFFFQQKRVKESDSEVKETTLTNTACKAKICSFQVHIFISTLSKTNKNTPFYSSPLCFIWLCLLSAWFFLLIEAIFYMGSLFPLLEGMKNRNQYEKRKKKRVSSHALVEAVSIASSTVVWFLLKRRMLCLFTDRGVKQVFRAKFASVKVCKYKQTLPKLNN